MVLTERFPRVIAVPSAHYSDAAMSNATTNATIWYGNLAYVNDGCRQHLFLFKIAATPLQIETWLLATVDSLGSRHHSIQRQHRRLSTTYCLATIHVLQTYI